MEHQAKEVGNLVLVNIYDQPTSSFGNNHQLNINKSIPDQDARVVGDLNAHDDSWRCSSQWYPWGKISPKRLLIKVRCDQWRRSNKITIQWAIHLTWQLLVPGATPCVAVWNVISPPANSDQSNDCQTKTIYEKRTYVNPFFSEIQLGVVGRILFSRVCQHSWISQYLCRGEDFLKLSQQIFQAMIHPDSALRTGTRKATKVAKKMDSQNEQKGKPAVGKAGHFNL